MTGNAAAPAARCKNWRRGSFIGVILPDRRLHALKWARVRDTSVDRPHKSSSEWMPADGIGLPPKRDFGTSRWAARRLGYINQMAGRKGHDRLWHGSDLTRRPT